MKFLGKGSGVRGKKIDIRVTCCMPQGILSLSVLIQKIEITAVITQVYLDLLHTLSLFIHKTTSIFTLHFPHDHRKRKAHYREHGKVKT